MNLTIGKLAQEYGLSRSTLLYYDRIGLLSPCSHRKPYLSVQYLFQASQKTLQLPFDIFTGIYRVMKKKHTLNHKSILPGEYRTRGRIWIESEGGTFLGYGRVVLLERVQRHGSITQAARSMKMSYKHAWDLIHSMNRQAQEPLLLTSKGGKGGGGAQLTSAGEKAIAQFWQFHKRFLDFLVAETTKLKS